MKYLYIILIFILLLVYLCYSSCDCVKEQFEEVKPYVKKNILKTLKSIDTIFNKYDIWYVSAFGTLLGGVRHWGMIPWDDDGDLLIKRQDVDKIMSLKNEFEKEGLKLEKDWKLIKVYMNEDKFPFIDLFINDDIDGKFLRCMEPYINKCEYPDKRKEHDWWWKWTGFPTLWIMDRKRIKFEDFELWAPVKSLELLKFWYGDDVLTTCKTQELDHITGDSVVPISKTCSELNSFPQPQL